MNTLQELRKKLSSQFDAETVNLMLQVFEPASFGGTVVLEPTAIQEQIIEIQRQTQEQIAELQNHTHQCICEIQNQTPAPPSEDVQAQIQALQNDLQSQIITIQNQANSQIQDLQNQFSNLQSGNSYDIEYICFNMKNEFNADNYEVDFPLPLNIDLEKSVINTDSNFNFEVTENIVFGYTTNDLLLINLELEVSGNKRFEVFMSNDENRKLLSRTGNIFRDGENVLNLSGQIITDDSTIKGGLRFFVASDNSLLIKRGLLTITRLRKGVADLRE
jgi:hypothetical protein